MDKCLILATTQHNELSLKEKDILHLLVISSCPSSLRKLKVSVAKIEQVNKDVIAALSGKRKVISRPKRSVKYKAMAKLPCNKCDTSFINNA